MAADLPATRLELPADPSAPTRARRALTALADGDPELSQRLALLVTELVSNSVRHAGLQPGDRIAIVAHRAASALRVEVCDPGRGDGLPVVREEDPMRLEGGLGLRLVERLASAWGAERVPGDGTRAWFELTA